LPQDGRHSWRSQAHHKCVYSIYIYTYKQYHTIIQSLWGQPCCWFVSLPIYIYLHTMIRINDSRFLQLLLHTHTHIYILSGELRYW
jgi:hypothetical protein